MIVIKYGGNALAGASDADAAGCGAEKLQHDLWAVGKDKAARRRDKRIL